MIELQDHFDGVVLPVRAQPGASKTGLRGEQNGALKVAVTQIAEKGKANAVLVETLADELGIKRSQIELLSGAAQSQKRFLIRDITRAELEQRIASASG